MKMLRLYIGCMLLMMVSCKEEIIYDLSGGKPILFSQSMGVESYSDSRTRTASPAPASGSLTSLNGQSFGVRGFIYDGNWLEAEAMAKPDPTWQNVEVRCDASGICDYTTNQLKVQTWEPKKNYAFFGYYPYGITGVTLSSHNDYKSPILQYNLSDKAVGNAGNGWKGNASAMYDVMYGSVIDANELKSTTVELPFKHALFGAQVVIENFGDQPVVIEGLSIELGLKYRGIDIPMNGAPVKLKPFSEPVDKPNIQKVSFEYIKQGTDPAVTVNSTLNLQPIDVSKGKHLLLIPQKGMSLTATVQVQGKKDPHIIKQDFPNSDLQAGIRYVFDIQFIGEDINLIIIEGTQWDPKDNNIEFE